MASTFKINQDGNLRTITFSIKLTANGMTFTPIMGSTNTEVYINGDYLDITISGIDSDSVSKHIGVYMEGSSYYGHLEANLSPYQSSSDVNFNYWKSCVTTHNNQMVIADLQCIYDKDKADGNYDDFLIFNIEVDNINVDIRLTIEHPAFFIIK